MEIKRDKLEYINLLMRTAERDIGQALQRRRLVILVGLLWVCDICLVLCLSCREGDVEGVEAIN